MTMAPLAFGNPLRPTSRCQAILDCLLTRRGQLICSLDRRTDYGQSMALGSSTGAGNIRQVYLFNGAINRNGIRTSAGVVDIANAPTDDLIKAGIVGYWTAQYDPNGVVNNPFDQTAVAISTNAAVAYLAPLTGHEFEATTLYINGYAMPLTLVTGEYIPASMSGYTADPRFSPSTRACTGWKKSACGE